MCLDEVQNPCRYDGRFSTTRSGDNNRGTRLVFHGFSLVSIELHTFFGLKAKTS